MIVVLFLSFFILIAKAQWTPDPFCPWPVPAGDTTYFQYEGDCTKYIECFDGTKYVYQCDDGLWWHQEITNCDYPGDYCDPSLTPTVPPVTSSTPVEPTVTASTPVEPTVTASTPVEPTSTTNPLTTFGPDPRCVDNNSGYWPHPVSCNKYIECFEGNSYEMACPPGLFFSETQKDCVNAEESECCMSDEQC